MSAHGLAVATVAGDPASPVHRRDPRVKLLGLGAVTLVAVSSPATAWPVYLGCAATLAVVAAVARVPAATVWARARVVLPLVLFAAAFVPFVREGRVVAEAGPFDVTAEGLSTFAGVAAKTAIGTVSAVLLSATTPFPDVLRALDRLRAPRLFVLVTTLTYRYVFVLADEVRRMRTAMSARAYQPRHLLQTAPVGHAASALFLRAHARGERIYLAMAARGFTGTMPQAYPLRCGRADVLFLAAAALPLLALRIGFE
ncbi:MAG: cobalt ECF transporter T component CbiQ, partial [Solirubrobacteraceae bacterium]|nr:cobalt ECF transporter T component CbiQ [Solirubrobacteraceae bacterium]